METLQGGHRRGWATGKWGQVATFYISIPFPKTLVLLCVCPVWCLITLQVSKLTDMAKEKVELAKALLRAAENAKKPKAKAKAAATKSGEEAEIEAGGNSKVKKKKGTKKDA